MKVSKSKLQQIIKEELLYALREAKMGSFGEVDDELLDLMKKEEPLPYRNYSDEGTDAQEKAFWALLNKYNKWGAKEVMAAALVNGVIEDGDYDALELLIDPEKAKEDRAMRRQLPPGMGRPGPGMGKYGEASSYTVALFKSFGDMEAASVATVHPSLLPILQRVRRGWFGLRPGQNRGTRAQALGTSVGGRPLGSLQVPEIPKGSVLVIPGTKALPDGGEFLNYLASRHRSVKEDPVFMKNREKDAGYKIVDEKEWKESQYGEEAFEWGYQEDFFGQGKEIGEGKFSSFKEHQLITESFRKYLHK